MKSLPVPLSSALECHLRSRGVTDVHVTQSGDALRVLLVREVNLDPDFLLNAERSQASILSALLHRLDDDSRCFAAPTREPVFRIATRGRRRLARRVARKR